MTERSVKYVIVLKGVLQTDHSKWICYDPEPIREIPPASNPVTYVKGLMLLRFGPCSQINRYLSQRGTEPVFLLLQL